MIWGYFQCCKFYLQYLIHVVCANESLWVISTRVVTSSRFYDLLSTKCAIFGKSIVHESKKLCTNEHKGVALVLVGVICDYSAMETDGKYPRISVSFYLFFRMCFYFGLFRFMCVLLVRASFWEIYMNNPVNICEYLIELDAIRGNSIKFL